MIIEFKVANYRSINEEQTLSFVADRATRHPDNLIKRPGYRLLKAVGLFGANASGKSNIVKALGAMATFVRDSATKMNDGDPILAAEPYRLDPQTRGAPSRFEITFTTDGTVYTYGFAADRERVHEEWLSAKSETSEKGLFNFHRNSAGSVGDRECFWSSQLAPVGGLIFERTRENGLLLSTAARENVKELLPVYRYLRERVCVYDLSGPIDTLNIYAGSRFMQDATLREQVTFLLRDADVSIQNIAVRPSPLQPLPELGPGAAHDIGLLSEVVKDFFRSFGPSSVFTTRSDTNGNDVEFNFEKDESRGTNRLFALAVIILDTLGAGTLTVLDEMDASMHPLLTRKLLELFQSPQANPNGAQLLFTTHDPSLLDQELFRRDQIWLAEKCDGASTFFSLADIQPPIRNTEAFLGNYLTGRYGGTPHLGPAFDMVKTGSKA